VLDRSKGIPASLAEAKAKAVPVIAYGQFLNDVINFLIVAAAVFILIKQVNRLQRSVVRPAPAAAAATKQCPYCLSNVALGATRCAFCTSEIR
jgi:large conductance mechanosensitive channel